MEKLRLPAHKLPLFFESRGFVVVRRIPDPPSQISNDPPLITVPHHPSCGVDKMVYQCVFHGKLILF